jgi:aryl-alcohol dehydrogenase-like predicted oxidoreductase
VKYRKLGRTDIEVSVICQGCWSIVGDATWGEQDERDSIEAIQAALESGINFFDTAEGYGSGYSEQLLGRVLEKYREEVVLATKVSPSHFRPSELKRSCEASLKRLRTDWIDLYQLHWPNPDIPVADTLGTLEELKREGKIRAAGVSNFGVSYLGEATAAGRVESNQLCYSLLWRPLEHEIQPFCVEHDISILCYSPIAQGLLAGKFRRADDVPEGRARTRLFSGKRPQSRHNEPGYEEQTFAAVDELRRITNPLDCTMAQASLAWLLEQNIVASVIVGGRNAAQVRENAAAGDVELDVETIKAMREATEPIKDYAGINADMWQTDTRMERG